MGKSKSTTTQQTDQQFEQQEQVQQQQSQQQLQAQQQASQNLQNFFNTFFNTGQTQQTGQQAQQSTSSGTQTTGLSPLQQPVAERFFQDLMSQYTSGSLAPQVYGGDRVADLTPDQIAAQNMMRGYATGAGSDFANSVLGANSMLLDPNRMLNPQNIPGFQASQDAMVQQVTRNLQENILPAVRGEAILSGGYGGSRQGIAEGLSVGRTSDALASSLANMNLGAYTQGLQAMQNAIGMAPQTQAVGAAPAQLISQVGGQNQQQAQMEMDAERQRFQEQQAAPASTLSLLRSLMGVQGEFGGTTTTEQTGEQTGTSASTGTATESGQQAGMQLAQQIASMLGINLADMESFSQGSSSGTSSGTSTQTNKSRPSLLQSIGALAGLAMMPFTFGLVGPNANQGAATA